MDAAVPAGSDVAAIVVPFFVAAASVVVDPATVVVAEKGRSRQSSDSACLTISLQLF